MGRIAETCHQSSTGARREARAHAGDQSMRRGLAACLRAKVKRPVRLRRRTTRSTCLASTVPEPFLVARPSDCPNVPGTLAMSTVTLEGRLRRRALMLLPPVSVNASVQGLGMCVRYATTRGGDGAWWRAHGTSSRPGNGYVRFHFISAPFHPPARPRADPARRPAQRAITECQAPILIPAGPLLRRDPDILDALYARHHTARRRIERTSERTCTFLDSSVTLAVPVLYCMHMTSEPAPKV
ncbi:hypothetical protein K488DRAFT_88306 [Vararia minispora EC-137]|uniref:Uncharacterized protein n=1 Tax=Vararia minispora EC-137 TaxID=1314806 RepID=A0ACB8QDU6_9AGAM|nr:hypothetical protein K488DRAFT_88306 [Vararia minispora EC-137]